jgi:RNA polymerase-binding protein DksA
MNKEQTNKMLEILHEKRAGLARQVERLQQDVADSTEATENTKSPLNSADNASDAFDQDFAFMSMESEEELLRKVDHAIRLVKEGRYGQCEECAEPIPAERLEFLPWATMCLKCQERLERGELRRRRRNGSAFDIEDDGEEALIGDDRERV